MALGTLSLSGNDVIRKWKLWSTYSASPFVRPRPRGGQLGQASSDALPIAIYRTIYIASLSFSLVHPSTTYSDQL